MPSAARRHPGSLLAAVTHVKTGPHHFQLPRLARVKRLVGGMAGSVVVLTMDCCSLLLPQLFSVRSPHIKLLQATHALSSRQS